MNKENQKLCKACAKPIFGRKDKIYCDAYCRSNFQYKKSKISKGKKSLHEKIAKQLRKNKQILKKFNKSGKTIIQESELLTAGFNPSIFTHYWESKKGNQYRFVYEQGFMNFIEKNKAKYILITWQEYMEPQLKAKPSKRTYNKLK